jgi:hypothetical protein
MNNDEPRLIRAAYNARTITVYQAYRPEIADPAVRAGTFVPPFSHDRMTWIKPSFGWMMHRSGWAAKPGQERILAVEISRSGFEWALGHASLSHFASEVHESPEAWAEQKTSSPVRIQWDPDRSLQGGQLPRRAIQIGLSGSAVHHYVQDWICSITDITRLAREVQSLIRADRVAEAEHQLPAERVYPITAALATRIGAAGVLLSGGT